jgi:protein-S-isoprenylcysteine O-methyltransferase Ste14
MLRPTIHAVIYFFIHAVILFGAAGRIDWLMAWLYFFIHAASAVFLFRLGDTEMIQIRSSKEEGVKRWDKVLVVISVVLFSPVTFFIAGLDYGRFHWTPPLPIAVQMVALLFFAFGMFFSTWAMVVNKFFVKFIRIQSDRNHSVVTHGPYKYVRHPGYTGAVFSIIALPIAFGSLWALIPAVLGLSLLVIRTYFEDQILQNELEGYKEYAFNVRWRLLPGIW